MYGRQTTLLLAYARTQTNLANYKLRNGQRRPARPTGFSDSSKRRGL
jgi:hypothetical protein